MSLLSLVEQPARYDSGMIALKKVERLVGALVLNKTNLHDYRDASVIEDLWSELGMSESLPLVPGE